jgi:tRNA A-37 threonylcarbamoyl transferase component Bud32
MHELMEPVAPVLEEVRDDQYARWQAGERILVEDYLRSHPALADNEEALLDLIYSEVLLREEHGEEPQLEEYVRRFPHLEAALSRQLALHEALGALDTDRNADTLPPTGVIRDGVPSPATTALDTARMAPPPRLSGPMPTTIGNYEILEEIGRGGTGVVYKGRHRLLTNRIAAIKVIRASEQDTEAVARFQLEAQAVADLHHPNIVPIYELGTHQAGNEEVPFVALEYVEGGSLAKKINGTPLPPHEAAALLLPLAEAVAHAHGMGIIHRDLKPANVLLASEGCEPLSVEKPGGSHPPLTKITDFGLAKRLNTDSGQTRTGAIMGTPSYMAPEQAAGLNEQIGPASDIYALGAILYEMLTGRPPFKADTILNTLHQVVKLEPVPPRSLQAGVPRDLETICLKCLQKEPRKRYTSASDLGADLRRFLSGEPIHARPVSGLERTMKWIKRRPAAAALLGVSALALVAVVAVWAFFTVRLQEEKEHAREQERLAVREAEIATQNEITAKKQAERASNILKLVLARIDETVTSVRGAKMEELESGNIGSVFFELARSYAKAYAALNRDESLVLEDRKQLAEQYAASAVRLLNCAKNAKFFDHKWSVENRRALDTAKDLDCLRDREDFKRFVARLR